MLEGGASHVFYLTISDLQSIFQILKIIEYKTVLCLLHIGVNKWSHIFFAFEFAACFLFQKILVPDMERSLINILHVYISKIFEIVRHLIKTSYCN